MKMNSRTPYVFNFFFSQIKEVILVISGYDTNRGLCLHASRCTYVNLHIPMSWHKLKFVWCMFALVSLCMRREEKSARCCWMIYCTCNMLNMFWHLYAHHQELETILVLLPHVVCNALVKCRAAGYACCRAPDRQPAATKALHTIFGNNTCILVVSSSRWWAYKCPKHVEQITIAINHSVASSWFFFSTHK